MWPWPTLELTDYERQFVRPYEKEVTRQDGSRERLPGVLRRVYPITLSNDVTFAPDAKAIHVSRRSRVMGLTFSGDASYTRLQIEAANGTQYVQPDPRTNNYPYVTAMCAGSTYMDNSFVGGLPLFTVLSTAGDDVVLAAGGQAEPLGLDPNWELAPNEGLFFRGQWDDASGVAVRVLSIGVHVWEFPGMGTANRSIRR